MARSDRLHIPAFEKANQSLLHMFGDAVDLVDHQRSAIGVLQQTDVTLESSGKRAFFMAEQGPIRFGLPASRPALIVRSAALARGLAAVHCAYQHFLASAALAFDHYIGVRARGLGRDSKGCAKCRSRADHRIEIERCAQFFGQGLQLDRIGFARGCTAQRLQAGVQEPRA